MQRIAILTSGGDAPGMNAAIRAATRATVDRGAEMIGVRCGFAGLVRGEMAPLTARDVSGIIEMGGTILESGRCPEFVEPEIRERARRELEKNGISGLLVVGGSGSQEASLALYREGSRVNGIASTIDNDLAGTEVTIGADTAVNIALEAIDRLRTTATSHRRVFIIETMGRGCGYLALAAGLAGGAEVIVTPEYDIPASVVCDLLREARQRGKRHAVVVVAEGAKNDARSLFAALAEEGDPPLEPRLTVLGHIQRGGRPTAFDRLLATRLGARAATLMLEGRSGVLVGLRDGATTAIPLCQSAGIPKPLPAELLALVEAMRI